MSLVMMVSVGNLALGYGLAVYLGHGPAAGWQAIMFWQKGHGPATSSEPQVAPEHAVPASAPAHH